MKRGDATLLARSGDAGDAAAIKSRGPMGLLSARPPTGAIAPGSGRPSTRSGPAAPAPLLTAPIKVADRPVTQQGLSGMKMSVKGPQRQVLDKSYYLGLLRAKVNELTGESSKLHKDIETFNQENSVYLSYEKRAEGLAGEIKDLQGQLADYNMLLDKLNTNTEMDEVLSDIMTLKVQNDREAQSMDVIFTERRQKEEMIQAVDEAIAQEKCAAQDLVKKMSAENQEKYSEMKATNEDLLQEVDAAQEELDALAVKRERFEAELVHSLVKQEAVKLHEKLLELENHRNTLLVEEKAALSPVDERERLFRQVKENNQEIVSMEQQLTKVREKISRLAEEFQQLDTDAEDQQGERTQKYKQLQKREEEINVYLDSFEESKGQELQHVSESQSSIVALLERSSRSISRLQQLSAVTHTAQELRSMQEALSFKEGEMQKSQSTATGLSSESERLQQDLLNVEKLEGKVVTELKSLGAQLQLMTEQLLTYRDLDALKAAGESRKKKLQQERVSLAQRKESFRKTTQRMEERCETLRRHLQEDETHVELNNMERKWQYQEQNNFVMREFLASKAVESDYKAVMKSVQARLLEHNGFLRDALQGKRS